MRCLTAGLNVVHKLLEELSFLKRKKEFKQALLKGEQALEQKLLLLELKSGVSPEIYFTRVYRIVMLS